MLINKICLNVITALLVTSIPSLFAKPVNAFDVRTCAKVRLPETVDLLKPIDSTLATCLPDLEKINDEFASKIARNIIRTLSNLDVGNKGETRLSRVAYSIPGKEIIVEGSVQARQITTVRVPKYRTVREQVPIPITITKRVKECAHPTLGFRCTKWVEFDVKVPGVRMEWRTVQVPNGFQNEDRQLYSATCKYKYIYSLSTQESTPLLDCGQGGLANVKFNASAIARLLNGEMPTITSVISAIRFTPPGFTERLDDTYDKLRNTHTYSSIDSGGSGSITYFASRSFVEWASARNQSINVAATVASGGSLSGELSRELIEKLRGEFILFSQWAIQHSFNIATDKFFTLVKTGKLDISSLQAFEGVGTSFERIKFRTINVPLDQVTCLAGTNKCTPTVSEPRLGFVIVIDVSSIL